MVLLLVKPYCLLTVIVDITNMSVPIHFSFATFQNDHISEVISGAHALSRCQFLNVLWWGIYIGGDLGGTKWVLKAEQQPPVGPLSAAVSAVVLQQDFGKSLPSEVNWERLPVPALTDTNHSHRHFPCSILSLGSQMGLSTEATKQEWLEESKVSRSHLFVIFIFNYFNWHTHKFS